MIVYILINCIEELDNIKYYKIIIIGTLRTVV